MPIASGENRIGAIKWLLPLSKSIAFVVSAVVLADGYAAEPEYVFRAGTSAVDISPLTFPVRVNGGFLERSAKEVVDPLYARSIALDDGETRIVLCVVDTCMMPHDLIDGAKELVSAESGLSTAHMVVSATHTHSAPAAMGCLGTRVDPDYAAWLPGKIAESMAASLQNLQPARIGWASVDDWTHTHNRRWIRRADKVIDDPFGDATVRAHMHPGHESVDVIGPSGPVDPELSVLALQLHDGTPLAVVANYSQHYYGAPLLSADYFGFFGRTMAKRLGQASSEGPFVAMMSQGTSGDLARMNYGDPKLEDTMAAYSEAIAANAMNAYESIEWHDFVDLGIVEKKITLRHRVPDAARLDWAEGRVAALQGEIPQSQPDVYAHEAIYLHEKQKAELKLQAIRIGDLSIATLPNEVYAITGLKLKAQSPLVSHFNIGLANGAEGYIPPPEQFIFGGYTTWPARTAGLEIDAEPAIVETLLLALEEVSEKSRRSIDDAHGPYAKAIFAAKPLAYWRLNEIAGRIAHNAIGDGPDARIAGGAALYLPGVGIGSGTGNEEALRTSHFSGEAQINRAIHFADGMLEADVSYRNSEHSVAFWFWLGEKSGASIRDGTLTTLSTGHLLGYQLGNDGVANLILSNPDEGVEPTSGQAALSLGDWHFAVLRCDADGTRVFVNGRQVPDIEVGPIPCDRQSTLRFADGLEGKLDEIAVFDHALSDDEISQFWVTSRNK
jgi:hypothetical protein